MKKPEYFCYLTKKTKNGWETFIGENPSDIFIYKNEEGKNDFKKFYNRNLKLKRHLVGFFSYDFGHKVHNLPQRKKSNLNTPDIFFLALDKNFKNKKLQIPQSNKRNNSSIFKPEKSSAFYRENYKKIKEFILDGDIYQINYTQRLKATSNISSRQLFQNIIRENQVGYLAYIETPSFSILSASPESFVKIRGKYVYTSPIKGTRPRSSVDKQDQKLRDELIESEKEKAELNMITDLLRNDLGKFCKIGSVKVISKRKIQKCPQVWHTYSVIRGKIKKGSDPIDGITSMLPGGSITGCPKRRAMEIIDKLEPVKRGIYTGCIGHISSKQKMDFSIAIRTIIKKGKNLYLQVGGGIVYDSLEKAEFKETLDKTKSFKKIFK